MPLFHNGRPSIPKQKQKVVISFALKKKKEKKSGGMRIDWTFHKERQGWGKKGNPKEL